MIECLLGQPMKNEWMDSDHRWENEQVKGYVVAFHTALADYIHRSHMKFHRVMEHFVPVVFQKLGKDFAVVQVDCFDRSDDSCS